MRKFKKFVSTAIIAAMAGTLCLTGCGSNSSSESSTGSSKSEKQVTVAVVQPMSHTSLDQIRDTITSELGKDDNIKVVTDNANGDTAALSSIIENYKSEGVDIVVPIATSTAQTAKSVYDGKWVEGYYLRDQYHIGGEGHYFLSEGFRSVYSIYQYN